ncbi:MAG: TerB family tellurite resistance protein [Salaquimonas sp.]
MLKNVTQYIDRIVAAGKSEAKYSDQEIAEAIASIFKQMVIADGIVKKEEISTAIEQLVSHYGYLETGENAPTITEKFGDADNESLFAIATVINTSLSQTQRKQLKMQLVATALSDKEFHPYEQDFMELVDKLIKN